jgi:hypothetical protein
MPTSDYAELTTFTVDADWHDGPTLPGMEHAPPVGGALPTISRPVKDCVECGGLGRVGSAHGARFGAMALCSRGCPA